jgi:hypothetical protein
LSRRSARKTPNKSLRDNESNLGEISNKSESIRNVEENQSNVSEIDLENLISLKPVLARRSGRKLVAPDSTILNETTHPTTTESSQNKEAENPELSTR